MWPLVAVLVGDGVTTAAGPVEVRRGLALPGLAEEQDNDAAVVTAAGTGEGEGEGGAEVPGAGRYVECTSVCALRDGAGEEEAGVE